jgi:hypothetical protein
MYKPLPLPPPPRLASYQQDVGHDRPSQIKEEFAEKHESKTESQAVRGREAGSEHHRGWQEEADAAQVGVYTGEAVAQVLRHETAN